MTLIKCSECGKDVSDKAKSCPSCGNPILLEKKDRICPFCGGIVGNKAYKCPHCYSELNVETQIKNNGKTNILSVTGFIFGLISLFVDIFGILSILALVFSGVGLTQINNNNEKGTGFAVLGFIFGFLSLAYFVYKIIAFQETISIFYQ